MAVVEHPTPVPAFFTGLSTDVKPTKALKTFQTIPQGSVMYTTDTGVYYLYTSTGWVVHPGK